MMAAFLPLFILSGTFVYQLNAPEPLRYLMFMILPGGLTAGLIHGLFGAVQKDWLKIGRRVKID